MRTYSLLLLLILMACKTEIKQLPMSNRFTNKAIIGKSGDERLQEASGLAVSFKNPGHFWTHNDSGGEPALYLINEVGDLVLTVNLQGAKNRDWEDLAIVKDGSGIIYVGDIGDNYAERIGIRIYRIEEPRLDSLNEITLPITTMRIRYEEGPRDSETLMVDPFTNDLILLTKREDSILTYTFPFEAGTSKMIQSRGTMDLTQITAGDINENGEVLLKNYEQVFLLENPQKVAIIDLLLKGNIKLVDYEVERQGEALTWGLDGESFFLLSEWNDNLPQPFYKYY